MVVGEFEGWWQGTVRASRRRQEYEAALSWPISNSLIPRLGSAQAQCSESPGNTFLINAAVNAAVVASSTSFSASCRHLSISTRFSGDSKASALLRPPSKETHPPLRSSQLFGTSWPPSSRDGRFRTPSNQVRRRHFAFCRKCVALPRGEFALRNGAEAEKEGVDSTRKTKTHHLPPPRI